MPLCYVFAIKKYKHIILETAFTKHRTNINRQMSHLFKKIYKNCFLLIVETYFWHFTKIDKIENMIKSE